MNKKRTKIQEIESKYGMEINRVAVNKSDLLPVEVLDDN